MALNPGDTLLNNHYRIDRQLGRGGFGFVYLAEDRLLGEQVAIKELIPALVGDEVTLKRFLAEARATMRLRHERIVGTHNVFQEGGNYYIIMECMAGGSLEARLQERGPLPVEEAVQVAADTCEGLAYAHRRGIVHCDLKPANILFDREGRAKVADFGIAHVSGEMLTRSWMTPAGFVAGTLPYMSPEQADGVRDEPRIDVYAVGAVLYRMLTGQTYLEFDRQETPRAQMENLQRIYSREPEAPSTHRPGIPAWLDAAVLRALAKRPEARYGSAGEMRAALQEAGPGEAEPPTVLMEEGVPPAEQPEPTAAAEGVVPALAPARQAEPSPAVREAPRPARGEPHAAAEGAGLRPRAEEKEAPPVRPARGPARRGGLPAWFWPAAGAAAVLLVVVIAAIVAEGGKGGGQGVVPIEVPQAVATQVWARDDSVMVYVPAGTFGMGSDEGDLDASDDEKPRHEVYLDAFWIDLTEVTNGQYERCVEDGACNPPISFESRTRDRYYGNSRFDRYPVVYVDWQQANAYCIWAGKRLPSEAEWEKAARGQDGRTYPWGEGIDCDRANYRGEEVRCVGDLSEVGVYPSGASPYGVLDMAGNAFEWVSDWYDGEYYVISSDRNPPGPETGLNRVLRGGSWNDIAGLLRVADREAYEPSLAVDLFGFRCALSDSEPVSTSAPSPSPVHTPEPTRTPSPTATDTPQPTATLAPTPTVPQAGDTRTRSKDGMVTVYVPAGEFLMGATSSEISAVLSGCTNCQREWYADEQPQHTVTLDAFWIDRTEVSNAQYVRFLNELGTHQGQCEGWDCILTKAERDYGQILYQDGQYVVESGYEDYPIFYVAWYGAQAYCEWVGARLPTEAEWEKAARGTDGSRYPSANALNCDAVQYRACGEETVPVDSKVAGASPYGALHMVGNVWEWVADWYDSEYYANSPAENPEGPISGHSKVRRGGCCFNNWMNVRAATRSYASLAAGSNDGLVGFRCAASAGE